MIPRRHLLHWLIRWLLAVATAPLAAMAVATELAPQQGSELITNLLQISHSDATNFPSRRLVAVQLPGTVVVGGNSGGVALLDGSPAFYLLPASAELRFDRGQRFQIEGHCLLEGTNLVLESRPLIENDGLHTLNAKSAGLWLDAGRIPLRVRYFNRTGERGLAVFIEGPSLPRQEIPASILYHPEAGQSGAISWAKGLTFKCCEGDWSALPDFDALPAATNGVAADFDIGVSGRGDFFGLQFDGFVDIPRAGFYTFSSASDDGSLVDVGKTGISIKPAGRVELPPLPRLAAGQLINDGVALFCAALEGTVTSAVRDDDGLQLELSSGRGRAAVRLASRFEMDPQWLIGARVLASGFCQSAFTPEGYQVAGELTVFSDEQLQVLDLPKRSWDSQPVLSTRQIAGNLLTNHQPLLVHARGIWEVNIAAPKIRDETGEMFLSAGDSLGLEPGARVEALGMASFANAKLRLRCYALRKIAAARGDETRELPLLTTVEEVKQMSRDEAKLGYPVKVRGVITFVWPDAGFFLQDATWSIDVRLGTNALKSAPRIGEYWEVEGETFAEFAPDILALRANRLGVGTLPEPAHPSWTELMDGSMDTQYIEVQGVLLSAEGSTINLLTRGGRIRAKLPEMSNALLAKFQGALVRVRGCVIPGRDVQTQQVKLGEFELRNASVTVDEPAPQDLFALPLIHATDLLLFDSHASPIQRAKIGGIVLQQRDDVAFLLDRSNGVRVVVEGDAGLHPGDQVEVVGFPDLTGPSPVFHSALVRCLARKSLPAAVRLTADNLVSDRFDSTLVSLEGTLVSQRTSGADQVLEMRSGTHRWLARLPLRAGTLPGLALGSVLNLSGVYAGQGGDRARGRDIDSFELLLNSPQDALVVRSPSWWTARHALALAGVLLAVLLLASIWIWALHRQVDERTLALKSEIEDHKRTELELEKQTQRLTRENEERLKIEAEVERGHKQLMVTSRLAGMAEVATSVLHNVGNVMTSVNVLSASIVDLVCNSKISSVARLGELLGRNRNALDRFVTTDERGRKMPDYVGQLGEHLANEQAMLLEKVRVLNENIHHINEIVAMQQDYATISGVLETLPAEEVVEDALRMHGESLKRHGIKLVRDYARIPAVTTDRHKVLQILFNLLENAKYACLQGTTADKKIVVSLEHTPAGFVRLSVWDNGMGISPENLSRIFGQGFSTRKDGHGFGLHSSILAAQDMGGSLTARSDGSGKGAVFVLEIPMTLRREQRPQN